MKQYGINFLPTILDKSKQRSQQLSEKNQNIQNPSSKCRQNRISKNTGRLVPLGILPHILDKKILPSNKLSSISLSMHTSCNPKFYQEPLKEKYNKKGQLKVNKQKQKISHQETKIKRIGKLNPTKAVSIYVENNSSYENNQLEKYQTKSNKIQKSTKKLESICNSLYNKNFAIGLYKKKLIKKNQNKENDNIDYVKQLDFTIKNKQKLQKSFQNQSSLQVEKNKLQHMQLEQKLHQYTYNIVISYVSRNKSEQIKVVSQTYKHCINIKIPKNDIDPMITYRTSSTYSQTKSINPKTNSQTQLEIPAPKKGKKNRKKSILQLKRCDIFSKPKQNSMIPFKSTNSARSYSNHNDICEKQKKYNRKIPVDETPHIQFRSHPYLQSINLLKNESNIKNTKSKQISRVSINYLLQKCNKQDKKRVKQKSRFSKQLKTNKSALFPQQH